MHCIRLRLSVTANTLMLVIDITPADVNTLLHILDHDAGSLTTIFYFFYTLQMLKCHSKSTSIHKSVAGASGGKEPRL